MKAQANKHKTEVEFQEGDAVCVKLQPYWQSYVIPRACHKLVAKYFRPFYIVAKIGKVAYKLQLHPNSQVHPVFHVSQLKKHIGMVPIQSFMPDINENGLIRIEPIAILDKRLGRKVNHAEVYVLTQWSNTPREKATWELYLNIEKRFPHFNLQA